MTIYAQFRQNNRCGSQWALFKVLFSQEELKRLNTPSTKPYADDIDHIQDYCLKHRLNFMREKKIEETDLTALQKDSEDKNFDRTRRFLQMLDHLRQLLDEHISARLTATRAADVCLRLVSLQHHLQLTDKEREAFAYMIATCIGLNSTENENFTLKALGECCRMSLQEILDFVDDDRRHIREILVELQGNGNTAFLSGKFSLAGEINKLMSGRTLKDEELLKIEGTVLADILAEEGLSLTAVVKAREPADLHGPCNESSIRMEPAEENGREEDRLLPYKNDQEYLDDQFAWYLAAMEYLKKKESDFYDRLEEKSRTETLRDMKGKEKMLRRRCAMRLRLTRNNGLWYPRLERLVREYDLCELEKNILVLLVGAVLVEGFAQYLSGIRGMSGGLAEVSDVMNLFSDSLEDQIRMRQYFYRDAPLVREGLIIVNGGFSQDVLNWGLDIDRKTLDYIAGLDTELNNIVDGSHLYQPTVRLDHVILPEDQKSMILDAVGNYPRFIENRKKYGLDDVIQYGRSIVILFHGSPGTGKTMMANALAHQLGKKILLVNFPTLGSFESDQLLSFFLRIATVNDAIMLLDECDAIFESRDNGNKDITQLLTAIERYEGVIIMATNRPFQLDKAMRRRITMEVEFKQPDPNFRERIWKEHLPPALPVSKDIDLRALAVRYEFSGGFIKNAVLVALARAGSRREEELLITMADLEHGADQQLRRHLGRGDLDRKIVPKSGLNALVLPSGLKESIQKAINFEKARNVLFGQWGFEEITSYGYGNGVLFYGPPGTGKTMAAEAIGYEIGSPLLVVNVAELISKYVGESAKNIESVFREAAVNNCIPVFDEADGLFAERTAGGAAVDRYANMDINLLLHHMERFPGMVVLTTNLIDNIDQAIFRRLKFILEFKKPDRTLRARLWQQLIPGKTPLADDIDFKALANQYEFTGGNIKNCIFKAAARAALRPDKKRRIEMEDLILAAGEEYGVGKEKRIGF